VRVIEIRQSFGLENLLPGERPDPEPAEGQILLRMRAASLNYRDLLTVKGHYNPKQPLPLIPCSDGVGEVVATGPGASRFATGDRVSPIFAQRWLAGGPVAERLRSTLGGPLDGTLSELMLLHEDGAVSVPDVLTDEEAAALPCAAVTAWSAVALHGEVKAGDVVLVQGTGGVSIFALQFSRMMGARVIVTSSSDRKLERARELGAWETINYRETADWGKQARKLTGGEGVDLVVEVGGAGTLAQSLAAVRFGGRIGLIGNLAGGETELNLISILMRQIRVQGILVGHREGFESMNRAIAANAIRPVVDRVFRWSRHGRAWNTSRPAATSARSV